MAEPDKCLYRSWTHTVNGESCKGQACYPGNSGFYNPDRLELGQKMKEPLRGSGGKYHTAQLIKCKYPECI